MSFLDSFANPLPPVSPRFDTPRLFCLSVLLKNEENVFPWTGYVFANSEADAVGFVSKKYEGYIPDVLDICEHIPVAGQVFPTRLTRGFPA